MLKRMILINSANFQLADIDLSNDVFFVGDNVAGKTTNTRAIHFLYNGNGEKLGITKNQNSFAQHYFPTEDSYIIYVFETFFILTYKRNNTIKRYFSKQEFDISKIIQNEKLLDFKDIETYTKSASLYFKPQTINEYTSTLYGQNRKYKDFAIANIGNHEIFLEVFNMIFNIDKAIVSSNDIKKAIQKSLDRKDEVLNIDYESFIGKLNDFTKAYNFYKIFDGNRTNLKNAIDIKNNLLSLEKMQYLKHKEISHKHQIEVNETNKQSKLIEETKELIIRTKKKTKNIKNLNESFEARMQNKVKELNKELASLEVLKEKFDPLEIEEKTLTANRFIGVKEEFKSKSYSLQKLKEEQTTAQQEIEKQILQIRYKISTTIPNETKKIIYELSEIEHSKCETEKMEVIKEYDELLQKVNNKIEELESNNETLKKQRNDVDLLEINEKDNEKKRVKKIVKPMEAKEIELNSEVNTLRNKINKLQRNKFDKELLYKDHLEKYNSLRIKNTKTLKLIREKLNNQILSNRAILSPTPNSFKEFLSKEIDGWEKVIYPIMDKELLGKSCVELEPEIIDANTPIGFSINADVLGTYPTKDEAIENIKKLKIKKAEALKDSKEIYKSEVSKLNETKNQILADIESYELEINNTIEQKSSIEAQVEIIGISLKEISEKLISTIEDMEKKYNNSRKILKNKIDKFLFEIKSSNEEIRTLNSSKAEAINKCDKARDKNKGIIKQQELKKGNVRVSEENKKIQEFEDSKKSLDKNDLMSKLSREVEALESELQLVHVAIKYLEEYEESKNDILQLPAKQILANNYDNLLARRRLLINKIATSSSEKIELLIIKKDRLEKEVIKYKLGANKFKELKLETVEDSIETNEFLIDLLNAYEEIKHEYRIEKSKFRVLIDKLKKLELYSLIELNFNMKKFDDVETITELDNIIDSINELDNFEKNKYNSEKKRSHNNFDTFLRNTIPGKLQSFNDLEDEFIKATKSINRNLAHADFGVIKDIRLDVDVSKSRNDSISSLLQELASKVKDTVGLYSNKSLFYHDISKSVKNIDDIQVILSEIKKKSSKGTINLFDTIDLSISYIENGKKTENKLNIKDDSSSGGNILLKVGIAMSILNRYAKMTSIESPFFLIIDEISKLQNKNQQLIRNYINNCGFKTLFITPDPAYPESEKAIYYTFKNIQEKGEMLEINQMNII